MKSTNIAEFKGVFDKKLKQLLDGKLAQSHKIITDQFLLKLVDQGTKIALSGGKRIRPYVCNLMYQTAGGKQDEPVMSLMLGLELVHTFALIHDDIIDQAKQRHGVLTVHAYAKQLLKQEKRVGDIDHLAQSQAILVGDLIMVWAAELFMELPKMKGQFNSLMNELILGQMVDADFSTRLTVTEKQIRQRIVLKSALYSFVQPMLFGRLVTGKNSQLDKFSKLFGTALGTGFQIQDDLLDIIGNAKKMRKPVLSDLRGGQHTLFTQYIFDHGTPIQKRQLRQLFGKQLTVADQPRVVQLFQSTGAIKYGRKLLDKEFVKAEIILQNTKMPKQYKHSWQELIELLRNRIS